MKIKHTFQHLKFSTPLPDCKGRATLPAIDVFSACIRYLKEHLLKMCREKEIGIREKEMHWVLTVPAIWDDSAKQFMREAGVKVSGKIGLWPRTTSKTICWVKQYTGKYFINISYVIFQNYLQVLFKQCLAS